MSESDSSWRVMQTSKVTYVCVLVNSCGLEYGASARNCLCNVDRVWCIDELGGEVVPDDIDENISRIGGVSSWSSKVISKDTELFNKN